MLLSKISKILLMCSISCGFSHASDGGLNLSDSDFDVQSESPQQIQILNDGYSALEKRVELIEKAKKTIDLETFIWRADDSGQILIHALIKKAREGVKVRLLIDKFIGSKGINFFIAHELRKENIEIKYYNPTPLYRVVEAQWRNHKKSLTIDKKETIIGGRNIGDEYFDLSHAYNFVDRDIWLEGDLVDAVALSFESIWTSKESVAVKRDKKPNRKDLKYMRGSRGSSRRLIQFENDLRVWKENVKFALDFVNLENEKYNLRDEVRYISLMQAPNQYYGTCSSGSFVSDRPMSHDTGKTARILKKEIYKRIQNSKESIQIESPYFIVNNETENTLKNALKRGVKTSLLTNYLYSTDAIYVSAAFNSIAKDWLSSGMNIHLYAGDTQTQYETIDDQVQSSRWGTHAKSAVFDDDSIMIGSFNFDPRSYNFSAELAFFCDGDKNLARALKEDIEQRQRDSKLLTKSDLLNDPDSIDESLFHRVGFGKKVLYYLLKGPSNLFDFIL
ncbi:phosphatidylserine/phosphatidylglycerophosphate/cardiolipin synthase family protein [Halobacteriovorax sp.]|uniref:phospholipase D-like domain-containing protein n=1 Tax=Halobacteriovorax sp. TaxID=2020862 RepID=UPI0035612E51